ncbi:MAG TPA: helix-turn-helix domain-containing protein [Candidatus Thermoplasmatota archaeon]|nr:helix-turn-helix domain-containing protein [Candidatus Thermoplasmatota archaeon]
MRAHVMTPTRRELLQHVRSAPGSSTRALARRAGLDESTTAYHLARLARVGLVVEERAGNAVAHFPNGWGDARARRYATLSTEARVALAVLADLGVARAAEVARWSGIPIGAARHALALAEKRGLARRTNKRGFFEVVA